MSDTGGSGQRWGVGLCRWGLDGGQSWGSPCWARFLGHLWLKLLQLVVRVRIFSYFTTM